MSPAKHSAICAEIQQLHQAKESKLLARIAKLEAQRTWVGLNDREIDELWTSLHDDFANPPSATRYERAIEAKLKAKNTGDKNDTR